MDIRHHIPDDILFLYASGELSQLWSVGVATHLAVCPKCRDRVAAYEEVVGASVETEEAAEMAFTSVDDIIQAAEARAEPIPAPSSQTVQSASGQPVFPTPLRDICGDLDSVKWSPLGGGVKQHVFRSEGGISARLLYIPPSVAVPAHGHGGLEFTQVLSGGFFDGDQAFKRGDIQVVAHESPHQPVAMSDEACVCLAITDAPLKFSNWLPRMLQPIFKI